MMIDNEALKTQNRSAFVDTPFPGQGNITNSDQSDVTAALETVFADKRDWAIKVSTRP